MKKVCIISGLIVFALVISAITIYPYPDKPAKAVGPPNPWPSNVPDMENDFTDKIWMFSDIQIRFLYGDEARYNWSTWSANLTFHDVNTLDWDAALCAGDLVDGEGYGGTEYEWILRLYADHLTNYYPEYVTLLASKPIDDPPNNYPIHHHYGNHECEDNINDWRNYIRNTGDDFVWYYGNIAFIMESACSKAAVDANWIQTQINAHQTNITIISEHYPYEGKTLCHNVNYDRDFGINFADYDVDFWVAGHSHDPVKNDSVNWSISQVPSSCGYTPSICSSLNVEGNTSFLNTGCMYGYKRYTYEPYPPYDVYPGPTTWFLCLINGSDQAYVACRVCTNLTPFEGWSGSVEDGQGIMNMSAYWEHNFSGWITLSKPFESPKDFLNGPDLGPQFISIGSGANGTATQDLTPTLIWVKTNDTSQYYLQIATDFAFTNLVVNLSDINEENYPTEYDESTNVTFTLPDAYALPSIKYYFYRVKAYSVE